MHESAVSCQIATDPFDILGPNIERMMDRRSGLSVLTPEEEDIEAIINLYREWRANQ